MTDTQQHQHHNLETVQAHVADLHTYHRNPRQGDIGAISVSLNVNGQYRPIVVNRGTHTGRPMEVLAGNHTLMAARELGWPTVAAVYVDVDDDAAARIVLADNRTADLGSYDEGVLADLIRSLDGDYAGSGYDGDDLDDILSTLNENPYDADLDPAGEVLTHAGAPPFTVLDARRGPWRERKRQWKGLGIRSEVGRDTALAFSSNGEDNLSQKIGLISDGTSVFDPVLTELLYRWFSAPGHHVVDPWAGGSVRGIVAHLTGREYTGIDLRPEQVASNQDQISVIDDAPATMTRAERLPTWLVGDSTETLATLPAESADMLIGCPPYYDLERYSDDPRDLSTMTVEQFDEAMFANVAAAARVLRPDRYAAFVVGNVRDKRGRLLDMTGLMVRACEAAGLTFHNDAVLVTMVGTVAMTVGRQFDTSRLLGRTHQAVLTFVKGDRKRAAAACGPVDVAADIAAATADESDD